MSSSGIYQILNRVTNRCYVGSAVHLGRRWNLHRCQARRGRHPNKRLQRSWDKHGEAAFEFKVLVVCAPEHLVLYEQICINAFDAARSGYNILPVAGSALGFKHSPEHIARLAGNQHALGLRHTAETRARMGKPGNKHSHGFRHPPEFGAAVSARLSGTKQTPAHVAARAAAHVGAKRSEAAKANMRAAWAARKAKQA